MSVTHDSLTLLNKRKKEEKEMMYPMDTLADMAKAQGFTVTPELLTLLNKSYELGVEDTY
jgi:hypothetical protein